MKNRYKKAFDEISPIRSDEELLRAVLDRKAETMKTTRKIGKKAIAIPVAAAVVLGMTAVGVGAAYQWNLSAAFEGLFRNRSETYSEKADSGIDFSRIGTEIGESWRGEGYTMTIEGAIADERNAYFYYTLAFDEDFPCDYAHEDVREGTGRFDWLIDLNTVELVSDGEPLNIGKSVSGHDCKWLDENTVQGVFSVYTDETILTDRELTLTVGGIFRDEFINDIHLNRLKVECGLSAELFFDRESVYQPVTFTSETPLKKGTLTMLTISTFSANYTIRGESYSIAEASLFEEPISLTLRDGTIVEIYGEAGATNGKEANIHADFSFPINPAEVASVQIEETVIDLTDQ